MSKIFDLINGKKEEISTLKSFINMADSDLINYLNDITEVTDNENYWFLRGSMEVVLVAHIDTVRENKNAVKCINSVVNNRPVILRENAILGADDRAGVSACLQLYLETGCSVLFTNYEETGGIGVSKFCKNNPVNFSETKLFLEVDRKGYMEYVTYDYLHTEIKEFLGNIGLREEHGSFSDIAVLSDVYKIPSINLAIGYYYQHTSNEYLDVEHYFNMIEIAREIIISYDVPLLRIADEVCDYSDYGWSSDNLFFNDDAIDLNLIVSDIAEIYGYTLSKEELDTISETVSFSPELEELIFQKIKEYKRDV